MKTVRFIVIKKITYKAVNVLKINLCLGNLYSSASLHLLILCVELSTLISSFDTVKEFTFSNWDCEILICGFGSDFNDGRWKSDFAVFSGARSNEE